MAIRLNWTTRTGSDRRHRRRCESPGDAGATHGRSPIDTEVLDREIADLRAALLILTEFERSLDDEI